MIKCVVISHQCAITGICSNCQVNLPSLLTAFFWRIVSIKLLLIFSLWFQWLPMKYGKEWLLSLAKLRRKPEGRDQQREYEKIWIRVNSLVMVSLWEYTRKFVFLWIISILSSCPYKIPTNKHFRNVTIYLQEGWVKLIFHLASF